MQLVPVMNILVIGQTQFFNFTEVNEECIDSIIKNMKSKSSTGGSNYDSLIWSNYDSLFARTVAYPVQVAYWNQRGHSPLRIQCPMSNLTSGPETWPWGPVGW